ncbi:MAG: Gfo/Idh/MocA family protein [Planctomycetota bacterium]|jgi:predicted dehydrogenase
MVDTKLTTGVIGLNEHGRLLLEAASASEYYEIVAAADKDTQLAEKACKEFGCSTYDDYRQLIIQNDLDCLLVGAGLHSCDEYLHAAIKKKFNILKWPPPGRSFEETVELVKISEENNVQFCIANVNRLSESFSAFRKHIGAGDIEHIYLLEVVYNAGDEIFPAWHNDRELSGGGVLLRNCYKLIDQIIMSFSLPQEVYCVATNTAGDRQQRHYLTEDTAIVTLKFREDFIGHITASKVFSAKEAFVRVFGKERILTLSQDFVSIADNKGKILEEKIYTFNAKVCAERLLEKFALSILKADKNKPYSTGRENLKNMAVIESAYLSSKTGMPESVMRVFEMGQIESINI